MTEITDKQKIIYYVRKRIEKVDLLSSQSVVDFIRENINCMTELMTLCIIENSPSLDYEDETLP